MHIDKKLKFKSKRNDVFRRGNDVVKHFFSRDDYMNESRVYDQLSGTLLAPKVIEKSDNCITTEFVDGMSLFDALESSLENPKEQIRLFMLFLDWYKRFREATGFILGDTNFRNFIIKEEKLYGIDFETCKEGAPVEDIVWQTAMLSTLRPAFSKERKNMARRFLSMSIQALDISLEDITLKVEQAFETICKRRNVALDSISIKEINGSVAVAACLLAGGKSSRMGTDKRLLRVGTETMIDATANNLELFAKKYLSVSQEELATKIDGFENTPDIKADCGPIGGMVSTMTKASAAWMLFVSCDMPFISNTLLDCLLRYRDEPYDAILFSENGKTRIFPLLLRTKAALPIFKKSLDSGAFTLWRAMEGKLRILTLKIEDCPEHTSDSLKNINTQEDYGKLKNLQTKN